MPITAVSYEEPRDTARRLLKGGMRYLAKCQHLAVGYFYVWRSVELLTQPKSPCVLETQAALDLLRSMQANMQIVLWREKLPLTPEDVAIMLMKLQRVCKSKPPNF